MRSSIFLIFFGAFVAIANCYSAGAPPTEEICKTMVPKHPSSPSKNYSPYTIIVDKTRVSPGEKINLSLKTTTDDQYFRGFLVQGRRYDYERDTEPIGNFLPDDNEDFKPINCGNNNTAITHKDGEVKNVVNLTWSSPKLKGTYVLLSTFVLDGKTYWVRQPSANITVV